MNKKTEINKKIVDQARKNKQSMSNSISLIRSSYRKILSIRIDLFYKPDRVITRTVKDLSHHRNKFIRAVNNSPLKDYLAYYWVFEHGKDKGPHCHCLFLYNGRERHSDWWIAKELGELWERVTESKGGYYNVNSSESKEGLRTWQRTEDYKNRLEEQFFGEAEVCYKVTLEYLDKDRNTLAIGQIKRSDGVSWWNMHLLTHYFMKYEQKLSPEQRKGIRCYGRSVKVKKKQKVVRR
jgi:hypothetical protein